jgi:hypothetical protein
MHETALGFGTNGDTDAHEGNEFVLETAGNDGIYNRELDSSSRQPNVSLCYAMSLR